MQLCVKSGCVTIVFMTIMFQTAVITCYTNIHCYDFLFLKQNFFLNIQNLLFFMFIYC